MFGVHLLAYQTLSYILCDLSSSRSTRNITSDLDSSLFLPGVWNQLSRELLLRPFAESSLRYTLCCRSRVHHTYVCGYLTSVQLPLILWIFVVLNLLSIPLWFFPSMSAGSEMLSTVLTHWPFVLPSSPIILYTLVTRFASGHSWKVEDWCHKKLYPEEDSKQVKGLGLFYF